MRQKDIKEKLKDRLEAQFKVPGWRDKVDRQATLAGGPERQPYADRLYPPVRDNEFSYRLVKIKAAFAEAGDWEASSKDRKIACVYRNPVFFNLEKKYFEPSNIERLNFLLIELKFCSV